MVIERELVRVGYVGSAMDLGAQLGYFSLRMAELGWLCLAVEGNRATHNAATLIQRATGIENVAYRNLRITSASIAALPRVDVVIFLSLWHHLVRAEGISAGKRILQEVLRRSRKLCFFETGLSTEHYQEWSTVLPAMGDDPVNWITQFLLECGARRVRCLGYFSTFLGPVPRPLFAAYMEDDVDCTPSRALSEPASTLEESIAICRS